MLFCERKGQIGKHPLVFLHGFLGTHELWKPFVDHLSKDYYTIAPDLPGHGKSAKGDLADVQKILPQDAVLIGYSMGGRIALSLFLDHPNLYHSAIIFSANPGLYTQEEIEKRKEEEQKIITSLQSLKLEQFVRQWYKKPLFGNLIPPSFAYKNNPEGLIHALTTFSITKQSNLWEKLVDCEKTISFAFGELDNKYQEIGRKIPKAKWIKNAAHSVLIQNPEDCLEHILTHLEEHLC